jgi:hypothetical protein
MDELEGGNAEQAFVVRGADHRDLDLNRYVFG